MDIDKIIETMDSTKNDSGFKACTGVTEADVDRTLEFLNKASSMGKNRRAVAFEEAQGTSDFPILLGGVINRMLMGEYQTANPVWRNYIRTKSVSDFRSYEVIKDWAFALLSEVKEQGEYPSFSGSEGKYTGTVKKYGRQYGISWEALVNDYLGAFNSIAQRMAKMALYTEWDLATRLTTIASGPNTALFGTVTDGADGGSVTNKGSLPLTVANLEATLTLMKSQVDINGNPLMVIPRYLVVPQALEYTARVILHSTSVMQVGGGSSSSLRGINNVIPQEGLQLIVNPWLTQIDASGKQGATWYLFAGTETPSCQMTFLSGYENPQVSVKSSDIQGGSVQNGDFEHDTIWYRVRHVLGGLVLDPRFCYAQTGS